MSEFATVSNNLSLCFAYSRIKKQVYSNLLAILMKHDVSAGTTLFKQGVCSLLNGDLVHLNWSKVFGQLICRQINSLSFYFFCFAYCRDLYLDGNFLECEGVIELIKLFADTAEMEAIERAEKKEADIVDANTLTVPGVPSAMSSMSRPTSSVSVKSKPARWVLRDWQVGSCACVRKFMVHVQ